MHIAPAGTSSHLETPSFLISRQGVASLNNSPLYSRVNLKNKNKSNYCFCDAKRILLALGLKGEISFCKINNSEVATAFAFGITYRITIKQTKFVPIEVRFAEKTDRVCFTIAIFFYLPDFKA
jgi:hypothetical protein